MSATAEYLTAAEKSAHETTTILKMTLPTAATSSSARAIANTFCAVIPTEPSSCAWHHLLGTLAHGMPYPLLLSLLHSQLPCLSWASEDA